MKEFINTDLNARHTKYGFESMFQAFADVTERLLLARPLSKADTRG